MTVLKSLEEEILCLKKDKKELELALIAASHAQLIGRDIEIGLKAELIQMRIELQQMPSNMDQNLHELNLLRQENHRILNSFVWKMCKAFLWLPSMIKRILRKILRTLQASARQNKG